MATAHKKKWARLATIALQIGYGPPKNLIQK